MQISPEAVCGSFYSAGAGHRHHSSWCPQQKNAPGRILSSTVDRPPAGHHPIFSFCRIKCKVYRIDFQYFFLFSIIALEIFQDRTSERIGTIWPIPQPMKKVVLIFPSINDLWEFTQVSKCSSCEVKVDQKTLESECSKKDIDLAVKKYKARAIIKE